ncbi:MAG: AarF/ABC1/UbiB kinase family protein [Candidatus Thiodiazotropha lotti]|nr:AarF/ABC1/UbiB kinase family protein [Candidatus Thiodiazotropha lotti]MCG7921582.1 AarF/ABC1/UbiB kinase family protein [Candidatus Thiodiazotropha lotti]MCG8003383.1 AarF/ABC1/UbiB kinase family protein [Candidatus Thiodiazotropha lotti]MCG8008729.1 AarF/ABC1/UbiB kinase family protein [Candidatus Thiodiazotropha lotti]MCW4187005.1 AarF/ABC1/UbiB kinase family protein [Candidatus Thiodiazotropha lotti]
MAQESNYKATQSHLPERRTSRLLKLGQLASQVAGGAVTEGFKRILSGRDKSAPSLILTPENANRLAEHLAELRGAAMKLGQMISMESGDLLPAEFSKILERLREDAHHMPLGQVAMVLDSNWGKLWERQFKRFHFTPIAAASIGQVHEATTKQGEHLAIKIQYPGIRNSIDSDVDNVATLLRLFRLIPKELDLSTLLAETKIQLHKEADYLNEAANTIEFKKRIKSIKGFRIPSTDLDRSTHEVLVMEYIPGRPLDQLASDPELVRRSVAERLVRLALHETFSWGTVQTDPNFANYRYDSQSDLLGLLDFGAIQFYEQHRTQAFIHLLQAALEGNTKQMELGAMDVGYLDEQAPDRYKTAVIELLKCVTEPIRISGEYDFANSDLMNRMSEQAIELRLNQKYWHLPPHDVLLLHRKLAGLYLACVRLKTKLNVRALAVELTI